MELRFYLWSRRQLYVSTSFRKRTQPLTRESYDQCVHARIHARVYYARVYYARVYF